MTIQCPRQFVSDRLKSVSSRLVDDLGKLSSIISLIANNAFVLPEPFAPIIVLTPSLKTKLAFWKFLKFLIFRLDICIIYPPLIAFLFILEQSE
ncbi:hypothetical protein D3C76_1389700 [compost metagenome]